MSKIHNCNFEVGECKTELTPVTLPTTLSSPPPTPPLPPPPPPPAVVVVTQTNITPSSSTTVAAVTAAATAAAASSSSSSYHATPTKNKLFREAITCTALSSVVIGLPIAIVILLINLPKLSSTRRDARQDHYILLAFGLPFSLVMIVSILYGLFRFIVYIKRGPEEFKNIPPIMPPSSSDHHCSIDDEHHLNPWSRTRMSWRRFSRRLRPSFRRHAHHDEELTSGYGHNRSRKRSHTYRTYPTDHPDCDSPKLFSVVEQVLEQKAELRDAYNTSMDHPYQCHNQTSPTNYSSSSFFHQNSHPDHCNCYSPSSNNNNNNDLTTHYNMPY